MSVGEGAGARAELSSESGASMEYGPVSSPVFPILKVLNLRFYSPFITF